MKQGKWIEGIKGIKLTSGMILSPKVLNFFDVCSSFMFSAFDEKDVETWISCNGLD